MTTKRDFLKLADLSLAEAREVLALARAPEARAEGAANAAAGGARRRHRPREGEHAHARLVRGGVRPARSAPGGPRRAGEPARSRRADPRHGARARALLRRDRLPHLHHRAPASRWPRRSVPVINALSDDGHPVQVLCDVFTIEEQLGCASRASASPSWGTARATWRAPGSRRRRSSASTWSWPGPRGHMPPADEVARAGSHVTLVHEPDARRRRAATS